MAKKSIQNFLFQLSYRDPAAEKVRGVLSGYFYRILSELKITSTDHKLGKLLNATSTRYLWGARALPVIPKDPTKITEADVREAIAIFANSVALQYRTLLDRPVEKTFDVTTITPEQRVRIDAYFDEEAYIPLIKEITALCLSAFEGVTAQCPLVPFVNPYEE